MNRKISGRDRPRLMHTAARHGVDLAEFNRLRRRLGLALVALLVVVTIGVVGFLVIGQGRHGLVDAIYMTVITLTTVGFGEIVEMSGNPAGRIFTMLLLIGGMGIAAYAVSMLAAFLIEGQLHHIFARRRMERTIERLSGHFVVCGDASATLHVVEELVNTQRGLVLVSPSEGILITARERFGDLPAVIGDPSDDQVLLASGLKQAAGVVFCMSNDKDNLVGVFTARRMAPTVRIIASSELPETRGKLTAAGADAVVSPARIGGLRMASELIRPTVVTFLDQMLRVQGGNLRVEEVAVPAGAEEKARTIGDLDVEDIEGAVLLAVRRAPESGFEFKPSALTHLEPGMALVVMADAEGRRRLEERLKNL
jgi:voltage-gated potassium channel